MLMDVYAESNFVLELALLQEQHVSCEKIIALAASNASSKCFLNRNSKDFDDPDIVDGLSAYHCKMLFNFDDGYGYISSQVS